MKLEDFLSQDDQERLLTITQSRHLKAAIADLYFRGESDQALMFSALDAQSVENLSLVWNSLTALAAED